MKILNNLKYTKSHEWVEFIDDTTAKIGITDYAQKELGDLVYANLPEVGDEIFAGDTFCDVESVKAVSDVLSPVTGVVAEVNDEVIDNPAFINEDAYGSWFIKASDITNVEDLMNAEEYEAFVKDLSN